MAPKSRRPSKGQQNAANHEDLYKTLGLSRSATSDDLKKAYRTLALRHHPDKNPSPESQELFKKISTAYNILSDPQKRKYYDEHGPEGLEMVDMTAEQFMSMFQEMFLDMLGGISIKVPAAHMHGTMGGLSMSM